MALSLFGRSNSLFDPFSFPSSWDPFELMEHSPARSFAQDARAIAGTRVDWVETPEAHLFKADLPGLTKEDIKVQLVDDRTLEISGERNREEEKKGDKWHQVERSHGRFLRRFRLPENAKTDAVTAKADHGVLTVTVPKIAKQEHHSSARNIDIA